MSATGRPAREEDEAPRLDVMIFGGGGAGLWLLDTLIAAGRRVILLEADRLGAGQTICAQGIIHGGLKYTLDGMFSRSTASIRDMPAVWRACLEGRRRPDLSNTRVRAQHCYLWRTASVRSRLAMIGARVGLRVAPETVDRKSRPDVLAGCPGTVARLDEQVIDPAGLLADLAAQHRPFILKIDAMAGLEFTVDQPGQIQAVHLTNPDGGRKVTLRPDHVIFTAGAGNAALADRIGLAQVAQQQNRPLHMLMMRGPLPELNGHCVDGAATRATITSDTDSQGRTVWQVGGQIAESGVSMEPEPFVFHAAAEIRAVLPELPLHGVSWASYRIDRAEADRGGRRPDDVSVVKTGNVIVAWPTKLALVPRLADMISAKLAGPAAGATDLPAGIFDDWPHPDVARPPWEVQEHWHHDV